MNLRQILHLFVGNFLPGGGVRRLQQGRRARDFDDLCNGANLQRQIHLRPLIDVKSNAVEDQPVETGRFGLQTVLAQPDLRKVIVADFVGREVIGGTRRHVSGAHYRPGDDGSARVEHLPIERGSNRLSMAYTTPDESER